MANPVSVVGDPARRLAVDSLKLNESPLFRRMVEEGKQSRRPLAEAFGDWRTCKVAIAALLGATAGEAVIWYGGQLYALFFLTQTLRVPGVGSETIGILPASSPPR